jgi:signal transduction histidine kinase
VTTTVLDEMKRFLRLGEEDARALAMFARHAAPHYRDIAEAFYSRLAEHDEARRAFTGPEQVERLKATLCTWMATLLSGPWDHTYFEGRVRIGWLHVKIGVAQRYVCAGFDLFRRPFQRIAAEAFASDPGARERVCESIDKILSLDLTIILQAYADAQLQEALAERERRAERLAALGTLTAGLAHEIRNPLNSAHLQLTVAQKRLAEPEPDLAPARTALVLADEELMRLAALVDDFLDFAAPAPLQRQKHDLRAIAEQALASQAAEAMKNGTELSLRPGDSAAASVDAPKLEEALRQLIRNAVEASGSGGRVHLRVNANQHRVLIEVEDDGPGLPAPESRLYEPFFTTKSLGTGLGLSIVHRIVTDHGGEVSAQRRDDRTVFTVTLPR